MLGVYFAGAGIGVAASALAVPSLLVTMGWQAGWLALGGLALAATLYGWLVLHRTSAPSYERVKARGGWSPRFMMRMLIAYCLFGAGYIAYATFIIAYLRQSRGFDRGSVTAFWAVLGSAAIIAAFAWGPVLGRFEGRMGRRGDDRHRDDRGSVATALVGGCGRVHLVHSLRRLFSRCHCGRDVICPQSAKPCAWTAAIAALTVAFGLGQCLGPRY